MTKLAASHTPRRDLAKVKAMGDNRYLLVGYLNDFMQCQKHQLLDENTTYDPNMAPTRFIQSHIIILKQPEAVAHFNR